jgi:hypothetical protein
VCGFIRYVIACDKRKAFAQESQRVAKARPMTGSATTASVEAQRAKAEAIHSFLCAAGWIASLALAMTVWRLAFLAV